MYHSVLRGFAAVSSFLVLLTVPAGAAVLTVDTTVDEFDAPPNATCSLREAVESANLDADFGGCVGDGVYGDDTILLPAGTYGLTRVPAEGFLDLDNSVGDLDVLSGLAPLRSSPDAQRLDRGIVADESLEILGEGAGSTIIERSSAETFGVLQSDFFVALRLVDLTVRGGEQVAGSGIFADFDLALERVVVRDNVARAEDAGGGGLVVFASLTMIDTLVTNNRVFLEDPCHSGPPTTGGGVFAFGIGEVLIERSTISNNVVTGDPGCEGFGGGLSLLAGFFPARIVNSTVSGNSSIFVGGVDLLVEGLFSAFNASLESGRNKAPASWTRGLGPSRLERGIMPPLPEPEPASLEHVTIAGNSAAEIGGLSLLSFDEIGEAVIENTLIGGNSALDAPDCSNFGVTVISQGTNLLSIDDALVDEGDVPCLTAPPDLVGTLANPLSPRLAPLADYGGETPTHALLFDSPAGDATTDQGETEDQRGVPRPVGPAFDIGAYEGVLSVTDIPTQGEWGLLLLILSLMASGVFWMRR